MTQPLKIATGRWLGLATARSEIARYPIRVLVRFVRRHETFVFECSKRRRGHPHTSNGKNNNAAREYCVQRHTHSEPCLGRHTKPHSTTVTRPRTGSSVAPFVTQGGVLRTLCGGCSLNKPLTLSKVLSGAASSTSGGGGTSDGRTGSFSTWSIEPRRAATDADWGTRSDRCSVAREGERDRCYQASANYSPEYLRASS